MNINENDVAKLVQQVLQEMTSGAPASAPKAQAAPSGDIPKTAKVAMMTELKHFEIQEYPIPELGDDDILVRVGGWPSWWSSLGIEMRKEMLTNIRMTHSHLSLLFLDTRVRVKS